MKRGLVLESTELYPAAEWGDRLRRLQRELSQRGIDWALLYGDVSASDDIGYLTNICIYWNEGVLAVPAAGRPELVTKLSARVLTWMRRVSTVETMHSTPRLAPKIAEVVGGGQVAIVDEGRWPAALLAAVRSALPAAAVSADGLVSAQRAVLSANEQAVARRVGGWLRDALSTARTPGEAELELRRLGCTDVLIDTAGSSVDMLAQYGHLWVRAARDHGPLAGAAATALDSIGGAIHPGTTPTEVADAVAARIGDDLHVEVTLVSGVQLTGLGELARPGAVADDTLVSVVIELLGAEASARVCDTYLVNGNAADGVTGRKEG